MDKINVIYDYDSSAELVVGQDGSKWDAGSTNRLVHSISRDPNVVAIAYGPLHETTNGWIRGQGYVSAKTVTHFIKTGEILELFK